MSFLSLRAAMTRRILVLDGATATVLGNGPADALVFSAPERVTELHQAYLTAGADILRTNTFTATRIALRDHALAARTVEINQRAASLARAAADTATRDDPGRPRWVAGVLGPTHGPADHAELTAAYVEAGGALMAGGADVLLIETIFDSRSAVAALAAVHVLEQLLGRAIPIMISATVDRAGRLPSGETLSAFHGIIASARPLAIGLNCGFGSAPMTAPLHALAHLAALPILMYPNAGLPDPHGGYPDAPEAFVAPLRMMAEQGVVNIVGGCCGTTPAHIAALAAAVGGIVPRPLA
jgi:5-methyltetrahydrofolate--homocysteine methyltransferase